MSSRQYFDADDGTRIPVHVKGQGPALVILHGWTGHFQDWRPVVERLKHRFTCYGWEARPYQGGSPTMARVGRDVANMLDALGLERPLLLGHSWGAAVAWEYLRQFGDGRLGGLCLVDQTPKLLTDDGWSLGLWGRFTAADNERYLNELRAGFADGVVRLVALSRQAVQGGPAYPPEFLEARRQRLLRMDPGPWIAAWDSFARQDYRDVLPTIRVPTFLAYGGKSAYYGPGVAEYVHRHIAGSELALYPEAGHAPQLEALEAFLHDFLAFAERHGLV